jgi:hypothetical protein
LDGGPKGNNGDRVKNGKKNGKKRERKTLAGRDRGARRPTLVGDTNLDAFVAH